MRLLFRRFPVAGVLVFSALLCAAALLGAPYFRTHAATITVTNTNDSGPGSLRQALADVPEGGTIQFNSALDGQTITLSSAELVINKTVTISGPGPGLLGVSRDQQATNFRILHVMPSHTVEISGVTISNGQLLSENGGGILNEQATLTMTNCAISGNVSNSSPPIQAGGGGIYNNGTLSLVNSTVSGNSATGTFSYGGGGIMSVGTLTITQSSISGNSGDMSGGGINNGGMLTISDSTVSSNHCSGFGHFSGFGGGISNGGTLTIQNTTLSGNTVAGEGGYGGGVWNNGSLTALNSSFLGNSAIKGGGIAMIGGSTIVTNCTISGNAGIFTGGGIYGGCTISNSTISGNTANQNGGGGIYGGGTITNSTFSGNTANQGGGIYATTAVQLGNTILKAGASGANIFNNGGSVTSLGYNLSSDNGGGFLTGPGDQINTDPLLGPLQDNGGPTFTQELLMGSPAINAGDPDFTPPPFYDQRDFGYLRVYNSRIDIGSFEAQPLPTVSPTPTPTATATPSPTPTLGNYPDTSIPLSTDTTVTPDAAPSNTTSFNVSTNSSFNGTFVASPTTGVVTVTDAHPAGTYMVTVRAFGPGGTTTKTFTLTVTSGIPCGTDFTYTGNVNVGANPQSIAIGDFNGDGKQDLAIANQISNTVSIRLGDGLGGFSGSTEVSVNSPYSVAIGDFNGDGKQDLAVASSSSNTVAIRLGDGLGGFSGATNVSVGSGPRSVAIGDFNGDGKQDLAVANSSSQTVSIRLGDGLGGFSGATDVSVGSDPRSVAIGDFNGDGKLDLAVANDGSQTASIRLGDGLGGFSGATDVSVGFLPASVAIGDFNGDGKQDLAVANSGSQTVSIRLGDGLGGFSGSTEIEVGSFGGTPTSIAIGDFDGDGKQDFTVANSGPGSNVPSTVSIRLGDGIGGFSGSTEITLGYHLTAVAIGDFNGDGKQDLAAADLASSAVSILLGQCGVGPTPTATATGTPPPTPTATATAHPTITPCEARTIVFGENFDGVTAPALPPGWSATNAIGPGPLWVTSATTPDTPPNDAFIDDPATVSDKRLDTPPILIPVFTGGSFLSFRHSYDLQNTFDGAVLEISFGAPGVFIDITDPTVGGFFFTGGYNATISTGSMSPIAGRMAWTGNSGGYIESAAYLGPKTIGVFKLRFRMASDNSISGTGWRVDNVFVSAIFCETPTPTPTQTPTPTPTPTPSTPSPTPSVTPSPTPAAQALNLSTRMLVQTGDNVGIGGFIITGSAPKQVILRGIGPSLADSGVPNPLADPILELHGPPGFVPIINDNWRDFDCTATGVVPPPNDLESQICTTLDPGAYTAIVRGNGDTSGVALVEVYDLSPEVPSKLANISTRAVVSTGADILIAGFILGGNVGDDNIIVRGIGPSLTAFGVPNALADPTLELRDSNGALIRADNDWQDDPAQAALITAAGLALTSPLESGIAATLAPGLYTALLAGLNNGTGVGLVEVYDSGPP